MWTGPEEVEVSWWRWVDVEGGERTFEGAWEVVHCGFQCAGIIGTIANRGLFECAIIVQTIVAVVERDEEGSRGQP
jgi:hypothetical protein